MRTGPVAGLGWHPRGDVERIEWSTSTGDAGGAAGRLTLLVGILEGEGGGGAVLPRLGAEVVVEAGAGGHGLGVEVGGERAVLCTTSQPTHRRPVSASTVTAPAPQRTAHYTAPRAPPPARNRQPVPRAGAQVAVAARAGDRPEAGAGGREGTPVSFIPDPTTGAAACVAACAPCRRDLGSGRASSAYTSTLSARARALRARRSPTFRGTMARTCAHLLRSCPPARPPPAPRRAWATHELLEQHLLRGWLFDLSGAI